jgi:3',5'-cyclic AMP phosphodiesterase CpdA
MFRIAHISDLHIPPLPRMSPAQLAGKRLLGLYSWHHKWKNEHRSSVLEALRAHLGEVAPDHICVTGDLTFTTHPEEVDRAAQWLAGLGEPESISLVPGNHDAYVSGALDYALDRWERWMRDDDGGAGFPYLQRRGPVNIVGLSSAVATAPAVSLGRIGRRQAEATRDLLERVADERRPIVLLVHHPPQDGATRRLRAFADRALLQDVLAQAPVDLVLHGHLHYPTRASLAGRDGPIPVRGAASASAFGGRKASAHYHVIDIDEDADGPVIRIHHAHFDPSAGSFLLSGGERI